jgi:hypothetical protein
MIASSNWTKCMRMSLAATCLLCFAGSVESQLPAAPATTPDSLAWPEVTQTARPWTRWWWLGSAVDDANITRLLEEYHKAGLGGVEITCIYGVRGAEDRNLPYLSDKWRDAVRHTLREAKRLGMGVDLPTGSGWRTGGPGVSEADANLNVDIEQQALDGGSEFKKSFNRQRPKALVAYGDNGQVVDITDKVGEDGTVEWQVPVGKWKVYTVTARWSRDNVKRPAPGGEGKNINPLSRRALTNYLDYFGKRIGVGSVLRQQDSPSEQSNQSQNSPDPLALPNFPLTAGLRAQFHDSYEYDGNWCDDFFAQFEKRRGYRLQEHLPELAGEGTGDDVGRIKHDYRETVSDLILEELIQPWTDWSHKHGMLSRNQGHGSPGNWLDIYAAVDIPETESFGRLVGGDGHPLVFKFASSAANVAGRPLVSAETATWIDEHFNETLGQVKEIIDRLFLAGVNHVIYHGTAYSPQDAAWPGWLFYASSQLNPQNPIWRDFPALNQYVARCQSVLQSTTPDNDILLYWPIHDYWSDYKGLRKDIRVHNARGWLFDTPFGKTAQWLDDNQFTFDYISDRQLALCRVKDRQIQTPGGGSYAIVIVPGARYLPLATLRNLTDLAKAGAKVGFLGDFPIGPPGKVTAESQAKWNEFLVQLKAQRPAVRPLPAAEQSPLKLEPDPPLFNEGEGFRAPHSYIAGLQPEQDIRKPLRFHRRAWDGGHVYFIKNDSNEPFDDWIVFASPFEQPLILDPGGGRVGFAYHMWGYRGGGNRNRGVRLQLGPGQAVFVKTFREPIDPGDRRFRHWSYRDLAGEPAPVRGEWVVDFVAGGPELPPAKTIDELESWTKFAAPKGERFAGTARYTIKFDAPNGPGRHVLDLGKVADSAELTFNGKQIATLFTSPFQVEVELLDNNELTVDVTNVAANRIRDMDRRKIAWRIFHDINLVSIKYGRFDASNWPIRDAGLLGPVTVQKLE